MKRLALIGAAVLTLAACQDDAKSLFEPRENPEVKVQDDLIHTPSGAVFSKAEWDAEVDKAPWLEPADKIVARITAAQESREKARAAGPNFSVTGTAAPSVLCHSSAYACSQISSLIPGSMITYWGDAQWAAATVSDFARFDAIYLHDTAAGSAAIVQSKDRWGTATTGRLALTGVHFEHCSGNASSGPCRVLKDAIAWIHAGSGTGLLMATQYGGLSYANNLMPTVAPYKGVTYSASGGGWDHVRITDPGHATMQNSTSASLSNFNQSSHSIFGQIGSFTSVAEICDVYSTYPNACTGTFRPHFLVTSVAVADQDGDGVPDASDNCPTVSNADQRDANGNGVGDACESAPTVTVSPTTSSVASGSPVTFTATAADTDDALNTLTYEWRVNGIMQSGQTGATFTASFTADATVRVTVRDPGNLSGFADAAVAIITNRAPTAAVSGPSTGDEGSELVFSGSGSTDPDGDPLTYAWTILDASGNEIATGTAANLKITFTDNGTYTLKLTVTDSKGLKSSEASATVNISNVAPVLGSITASRDPFAVNTSVSVSAPYSDAGLADTHTVLINWGDGSSSAGSASAGSATGSHVYTVAGVYTVTMTANDDDLADSNVSRFEYVVVYDPSAGFVTGGGWIDTKAGSYLANPSLSGKASFGFVSKYQKGATTPTGNTEFQFHAAGLVFKSSAYQWLVISGPKAQYKGEGTVNGVPGFQFILTANDGQVSGGGGVDRFRMKIMDASGAVVYDNQMGNADDAAANTALGGGSIVIHSK